MITTHAWNRMGLEYTIIGINALQTIIQCGDKSITVNVPMDQITAGWSQWIDENHLIQNVMPFLSADEREFIMTGITSTEWDEMFKKKETK